MAALKLPPLPISRRGARAERGSAPEVLVTGAFGQGNPGDEAVLDALVAALDGCDVAATFADGIAGSRPVRAIPARQPIAVASAALRADLVVVTATVFKTLHAASGRNRHSLLANTLALAAATRAVGRPMSMTAVGAGSLDSGAARALARAIITTAGAVQVRDEESADILRQAGVRQDLPVVSDVAWTIVGDPKPAAGAPSAGRPPTGAATQPATTRPTATQPVATQPTTTQRPKTVAVALSHLAGGPSLVENLASGLTELADDGFEVILQPWQPDGDDAMAAELASRLDGRAEVVAPPADLTAAAEWFATTGVLVGLRFHSLVAAGAAGCPFVAVAHEPKLLGLSRRLKQHDLPPDLDGHDLAEAVREAWAGPPPDATAVAAERELATETLAALRALAFHRSRSRRRGGTPPLRRWVRPAPS